MQGAENRKPGVQISAERRCHIYPNFPLQNKPQTDIFPLFYYKQIHYKTLTSEGNIFFSA